MVANQDYSLNSKKNFSDSSQIIRTYNGDKQFDATKIVSQNHSKEILEVMILLKLYVEYCI